MTDVEHGKGDNENRDDKEATDHEEDLDLPRTGGYPSSCWSS